MSSTFGSLGIATSALRYHQAAMDIASTNIANAGVDGYSRRLIIGQTSASGAAPALWSRSNDVGAGVEVGDVLRTVDLLMESRFRTESGILAATRVGAESLARVETALAEPGETGLQSGLAGLWDAWSRLAGSPDDGTARQQVLSAATVVTRGLNGLARAVDAEWASQREGLDAAVAEVNSQAEQLAQLNHDLRVATNAGVDTNTLLDRRDSLVRSLAELTGATATYSADGMASLSVGGQPLVDGQTAVPLTVSGAQTLTDQASDPVTLSLGGSAVTFPSGTVGGLMTVLGGTLPSQITELDQVAASLADRVNTLHRNGYDQDGNTGQDFFTGTTAASIAVALTSSDQVAAAGTPGTVDGSVASELARLATAIDGPDATYRSFVSALSTASSLTNQTVINQAVLVDSIDAARTSVSGVNVDEEMVHLVASQRGYEAAARVLTTLDSVLDTLINHTGVG